MHLILLSYFYYPSVLRYTELTEMITAQMIPHK